jgi:hypothetical protein
LALKGALPFAGERPDMDLKDHMRSVPDLPKRGISSCDISAMPLHAEACCGVMGHMVIAACAHQAARF